MARAFSAFDLVTHLVQFEIAWMFSIAALVILSSAVLTYSWNRDYPPQRPMATFTVRRFLFAFAIIMVTALPALLLPFVV